jgi:hypothetical protein
LVVDVSYIIVFGKPGVFLESISLIAQRDNLCDSWPRLSNSMLNNFSRIVSHPVFKTNQVLPICMPGSSSIHIVTSLVNNRNNIT